jgi:hypothetical protein
VKVLRIILLFFIIIACNKEIDDYKSTGTITGYDLRMCICCGGWIIIIDDGQYLIDTIPDNSDIDLTKETFPVKVKLDWQLTNNGCSSFGRITVLRIKKI